MDKCKDKLAQYRKKYLSTPLFIPDLGELPEKGLRSMYPVQETDMSSWLRSYYHPQIARYDPASSVGLKEYAYCRIFTIRPSSFPNKLKGCKLPMDVIYELAQIFTYQMLDDPVLLNRVQRTMNIVWDFQQAGDKDSVKENMSDVAIYMDQYILRRYKSLTKLADMLENFIVKET